MKYSTIPSAKNLVIDFKSQGIQDIIISPGSRNAPLILSFTSDAFFNCYSIVDERSAAFFALGMAQNQRRPVAVVCTSGSALLNYYPAVAEAYYSEIPLVVISADRPPYKIDVGDGQTIRQDHVFHRHIGYSANLKLDTSHATKAIEQFAPELLVEDQVQIDTYNRNEVNKALLMALEHQLPVHINIPFEEPLYGLRNYTNEELLPMEGPWQGFQAAKEDLQEFASIWQDTERKMVLVGVNYPNEIDPRILEILAQDPSVIVFTETTSNLHHQNFFPSIDSIIFPIEKSAERDSLFRRLRPDILLTFGGLVVSKKIKAFLRNYRPNHHWHVNETRPVNTYFSLTKHFKMRAESFLEALLDPKTFKESQYFSYWNNVKLAYEHQRQDYFEAAPFSDYKVFGTLLKFLPRHTQLQLSNSSTVRYAQLFNIHSSVKVFCNRGTSGIDGSTSTALGSAFYNAEPTVLITGDLSFFYDSNALWNNYKRPDFRVILINNSGGGIFRILPGREDSETFERFFETRQTQNAYHLCKQYGLEYHKAENMEELETVFQTFYNNSSEPRLLEVFTPRLFNDKILLGYFDFISSKDH